MNLNLPSWIWWCLGVILLLIVMALCKADFSIGSGGIHLTQHLVGGN
jgi:hypothetical protein